MNETEKHGHINEDLYRCRKGRIAMDPSNAGTAKCDAASCFDRMILAATSIAETNAGTLEEMSTTFAQKLEKMQYHMSAEKGVSDEFNCHSNNHPIHSTGQGATNSPPK
eukprot:14896062-Ditylum_brightwellii.AAC.1